MAAELRPVVLPDVEHADVLNPLIRRKGIASLVGVPLVVEGRPIGVLHVGTLERRTFTRDEVDLLQLAADRVAIALSHARAFESERAARRRVEHVQAIVDASLAHLELDALLDELLDRIRAILDVDTCTVLLVDPEPRDLFARAALGIEEEVEQGIRIPLGKGFAGRIAAEGRPIGLPDVDHRRGESTRPVHPDRRLGCRQRRSRGARAAALRPVRARRDRPGKRSRDREGVRERPRRRAALHLEERRIPASS